VTCLPAPRAAAHRLPRIAASLPVRSFGDGKRRLAEQLSAEQRRALIGRLLRGVVEALRESGVVAMISVVSGDEAVLRWAQHEQLVPLLEDERGLNGALRRSARWAQAVEADAHLVVLPDLPLLRADDVRAVVAAAPGRAVVACPDRWGTGTNMLLLQPPGAIGPAFGENSFSRHLDQARRAGLAVGTVDRPGTRWDLDTPGDLADLGITF